MKMFDKEGNIVSKKAAGKTGISKSQKQIFDMITEQSVKFAKGNADGILRLQEIKDAGKALQGNPWNLVLQKNHANAKVRHWLLRLTNSGCKVEVKGKVEVQKITALEFGDAVVFANLQAIRHVIADEKDKKVQLCMTERLKALTEMPRRESYY